MGIWLWEISLLSGSWSTVPSFLLHFMPHFRHKYFTVGSKPWHQDCVGHSLITFEGLFLIKTVVYLLNLLMIVVIMNWDTRPGVGNDSPLPWSDLRMCFDIVKLEGITSVVDWRNCEIRMLIYNLVDLSVWTAKMTKTSQEFVICYCCCGRKQRKGMLMFGSPPLFFRMVVRTNPCMSLSLESFLELCS